MYTYLYLLSNYEKLNILKARDIKLSQTHHPTSTVTQHQQPSTFHHPQKQSRIHRTIQRSLNDLMVWIPRWCGHSPTARHPGV